MELTVEADTAAALHIHIPPDPLLLLRAVEKPPVARNAQGRIIHRRIVLWQAVGPGKVAMNAIAVETQGRKLLFPEITITIRDPGP